MNEALKRQVDSLGPKARTQLKDRYTKLLQKRMERTVRSPPVSERG